jgi:hypothetical protein
MSSLVFWLCCATAVLFGTAALRAAEISVGWAALAAYVVTLDDSFLSLLSSYLRYIVNVIGGVSLVILHRVPAPAGSSKTPLWVIMCRGLLSFSVV